MPRKKFVSKVKVYPDLVFNSLLLSKFINYVMISGKKALAENIVYKALEIVGKEKKN